MKISAIIKFPYYKYKHICRRIHNKILILYIKRKILKNKPVPAKKSKYAVVIQGPVQENIIFSIIRYYRWSLKGASIIISTWNTIDQNLAVRLREAADYLVLNELPSICGRGNVNYQIESTLQGILKARETGAEIVLKVRSNSLLLGKDLFGFYEEQNKKSKLKEYVKYGLHARILTEYRRNFNDSVPFSLCDFTFMGYIDDMIKLWNIDRDVSSSYSTENMSTIESEKKCYLNKTYLEIFEERISAVIWISLGFCDNIGYEYRCDERQSKEYYNKLFIMLDRNCEFLIKYDNVSDNYWSIKPKISREWKKDYLKRNKNKTNYKLEIMFDEKHFTDKNYLAYIGKK